MTERVILRFEVTLYRHLFLHLVTRFCWCTPTFEDALPPLRRNTRRVIEFRGRDDYTKHHRENIRCEMLNVFDSHFVQVKHTVAKIAQSKIISRAISIPY